MRAGSSVTAVAAREGVNLAIVVESTAVVERWIASFTSSTG